jgi:YVTN family beta-propeller protein
VGRLQWIGSRSDREVENIREEKMKLNGTGALTTLFLIMLATVAWAALPNTINYQGYLRNTNGTPVSSQVTVVFSLYTTSSGGTPLWTESRNITPANGIYSHHLGSVTPFPAGLFANDSLWLGVKVGNDPEMTPREQLTPTPFAFRSGTADSVGSSALAVLDSRYIDPTETHATSQQIATLRWDQVTGGAGPYAVGTNPRALAFDGTNIWVANYGDGTVQKVNPATGATGPPINVGTNPYALAFDGSSIWVANYGSNSVQKINPATGAAGSPITVGTNPSALVFDGANIWVALQGSNSVRKIDPATGAVFTPITVGTNPIALAFDGTSIWVANSGSANVTRITPGETTYVNTFTVGEGPGALAFDGAGIWVANSTGNSLMRVDPASGAVQATYVSLMSGPRALAFDGRYVWAANYGGDSVIKVDTATGPLSPAIHVSGSPTALTFDGANLWTANYSGNSVIRLAGVAAVAGPLTVSGTALNSGSIAATQLADNAVTVSKLASNSVSSDKIQTGTITGNKLAAATITSDKIGFYGKIAIVAQSGGNYSNPATAMGGYASWCGTPSESNPCLLKIMPGVYNIGASSVVMQPYIDIEGSGENVTLIQGNPAGGWGVVDGANNAELRFLTVKNTGGSSWSTAISNSSASPRLTNLTAIASGGTTWNACVYNYGSSPTMTHMTINSEAAGSWSIGIFNKESSSPLLTNIRIDATGGTAWSTGINNDKSSPTINDVSITTACANGYDCNSVGVISSTSGTVRIYNSVIKANWQTVSSGSGVTTRVAHTQLDGGSAAGTGTLTCVGAYNGNFTALGTNCQ